MYKPKLISLLDDKESGFSKEQFLKDLIAGIIVAIIALPLSIALGISSGVSPEKGLITAIIAGFIISLLGGSRVQIGGPTGAFVVIVFGIIQNHGVDGLIIATFMAGIILVLFGLLRFGSLIKYIPYPITVGFTSGIAVTLFSTQVKDFLGLSMTKTPSEFIPKWEAYISHMNTTNLYTLAIGLLALIILIFWPKINKKIPGSLIALIVTTLVVFIFNLPVATIGSQFGKISSNIPMPHIPNLNLNTLKALIGPAFTIALLGGIESLLSAVVSDGMIGDKHNSNAELIAQGIANMGSSLFGGIPATGAIARTAANVKNGGRTPISGIVHSITLLLIMLVFMPLAKFIPLTTLSAILIIVSYNMSEWRTFKAILKAPKSDIAILLTTFFLTVLFDLVIAIGIGMVVSMCLFMRRVATSIEVNELNESDCSDKSNIDTDMENLKVGENVLVYDIRGHLFFGAVDTFMNTMKEINDDAKVLVLRMRHTKTLDVTGYKQIKNIALSCKSRNMTLIISELQEQPKKVMRLMGFIDTLGEDHFATNFDEALEKANSLI
ncbi:TPA: SulP family inorganic anion transporter [Clostridium perfringens]|uniref:SulP family inorganic anion transporter n=1 Tax=Clostridium perfringens TaxID=1502 RepID=UPI001CAF8413|nr:sulfate permease [Clostridium perfringens]ELC8402043.1 sulfate permease [Clostridium perfringens]MDH5094564.1 C4-dicarboxylic acid transporter DauA [Clostridium perfringens]MDH5098018.1 C4-dicarboxylic acid transporter DauA [Clostridium perfringens]MDK0883413.1 sulfate permease [Clostridium perfringens]MDK0909277.1 sulfate permease [Clostridium perfringens]